LCGGGAHALNSNSGCFWMRKGARTLQENCLVQGRRSKDVRAKSEGMAKEKAHDCQNMPQLIDSIRVTARFRGLKRGAFGLKMGALGRIPC
jgi:hypothetical protein